MSSTKYTLDRIEDGYAVFLKYPDEEEEHLVELVSLTQPVQVGDRVLITGEHLEILHEETAQKRAAMQNLMARLRKKRQHFE
ncbi:DUF3006 domain-containing protein [Lysinibacillus piscis]|uniref:DUF3006 domain-containing protein n=1 Tax=Lysinibacillus piscis TaxID=2518931 RepID=A0ABQ5NNE3_9BACI|nr:DUF3006 domain-containing protein [Lysinibacillus sp. KH24]GLC89890.1 hypothetical protein LYSBPC_30170 [Lysinibacillus sp. KH24]